MKKLLAVLLTLSGLFYYIGYTQSGLHTTFKIISTLTPGTLSVSQLNGTLFNTISLSNLKYQQQDTVVEIDQGKITWSPRFLINLELVIQSLDINQINIKTAASKSDQPSKPPVYLLKHLILYQANIQTIRITQDQTNTDIKHVLLIRHPNGEQQLTLSAFDGDISGRFVIRRKPSLTWQGELSFERINLQTIKPTLQGNVSFQVQSTGEWLSGATLPQTTKLTINHVQGTFAGYPITGDVDVSKDGKRYHINALTLSAAKAHLNLKGTIEDTWNLAWSLDLPNINTFLPSMQGQLLSSGNISGSYATPNMQFKLSGSRLKLHDLSINSMNTIGNIGDSELAKLSMNLKSIKYLDNTVNEIKSDILPVFKDGNLNIQLSAKDDQTNELKAQLALPGAIGSYNKSQPIKGQATFTLNSLWPIKLISSDIKDVSGSIDLAATIDGTIEHPLTRISAHAKNVALTIPRYGADIRNINITGTSEDLNHLNVVGQFTAGQGKGNVTGDIDINGLSLNAKITGHELQTTSSREYQFTINPTLAFSLSQNGMSLTGDIHIPKAHLQLNEYYNVVTLPDEVRFTHETIKKPSMPLNLALDIMITLGDSINVAYQNFEGKIAGKLNIKQIPGHPATGIGELHVISGGEYKAYGRTLSIKEARLMYSGNLLTNPGIYVRAQQSFKTPSIQQGGNRFFNDTGLQATYTGETTIIAGAQITGTVERPQVTLFSDPSGLSQGDILSYLLFGHPQAQAQGQSAGAVLSALSSMYSSNHNQIGGITDKVKGMFDLADVGVDSVDIFDPSTNTIVPTTTIGISKQLGRDLFIRYQVGVFHPASILNIRYQLSKRWMLQSETSPNENGADLLYSIETD